MGLLPIAFIAGILTVLAPCILPLLPVIIGGSVNGASKWRPYVVTASLSGSVILFTLILRGTTAFIGIPLWVWSFISGLIVILFGIITLFPDIWTRLGLTVAIKKQANAQMAKGHQDKSMGGAVLIGMSLGPVFASCSPTYALILALILPVSIFQGVLYITAYALGLGGIMLLISLFGKKIIDKLHWAADPQGTFKKVLGIIFILVGLGIMTGADKALEAELVDRGWIGITSFEENLLKEYKNQQEN